MSSTPDFDELADAVAQLSELIADIKQQIAAAQQETAAKLGDHAAPTPQAERLINLADDINAALNGDDDQ